jgi:hypothetical protein
MDREFTWRRLRRFAGLSSAVVLVVGLAAPSPSVGAVADTPSSDAVIVWNEIAAAAFVTAGQSSHVALLHMAMVQGAVYDAVNAIDGGYEPYLVAPRARPWFSKAAAAATAAHRVLVHLLPAQQATLDGHLAESLAVIADGRAENGGIRVGEAAAAAMVIARTGDGRFGMPGFPVGTEPGEWRPVLPLFVNDPGAWVKDVEPFLVPDVARFATAGHLPLTSAAYAADVDEVMEVGSATSSTRTADQTDAARYWSENAPNLWNRLFRDISATAGLGIVDNARLFAMLALTAADSAIAVWHDKEVNGFWRPITAIREADTDGNLATVADPDWLPLLPTPPFPEHPSGHSGVSGSIVRTLQQFFGSDRMHFEAVSNASGTVRSFDRFSEAIDEIIDARVWSGIHFREADEQGETIGIRIANFRLRNYFHPVD